MSILFRRIYWAADEEGGGVHPDEAAKAEAEALAQREKDEKEAGLRRRKKIEELQLERELLDNIKDAVERENKARQNKIDLMKLDLITGENLTETQKEQNQGTLNQIKGLQDGAEAFAESAAAGEDFAQTLFGIGDAAKRADKFSKILSKDGLAGLAKGFKKNLTVTNLASSALSTIAVKTFELAAAQDKAIASFRQSTGASKKYNLEIAALERSTFSAGVTVEDAAGAYKELYTSFNDFTKLNSAERKKIGATVTLVEKLGISAGDSAKILNTATKALGMNVDEADALMRDIVSTAQATGRSVGQVAADFAVVSSKLAFHGDKVTGIFQKLQMQAKSTGLEMNTLLGFAAQFDTFDGAGRAVGRLNAIMGGPYLNSIDMLNATEEERIEIMQRSMQQAGLSFDQMSKYEQLAIADAMGVSAEEARKMFGNVTEEMEIQRLKEEELVKQATEVQDIMSQLKSAMMGLAVSLRPTIERLSELITKFSEFIQKGDGAFGKNALWIAGVVYATAKIFPLIKGVYTLTKAMKGLQLASGPLLPVLAGFAAAVFTFQQLKKVMDPLPAIIAAIGAGLTVGAIAMAFFTGGSSVLAAVAAIGAVAALGGATYGVMKGKTTSAGEEGSKEQVGTGRFTKPQQFAQGGTVKPESGLEGAMKNLGGGLGGLGHGSSMMAGQMAGPAFHYGMERRAQKMGVPVQYSEGGNAEFGVTPAGTTFAKASTVNNLIAALNRNSAVTQQLLAQTTAGGGDEGGVVPQIVLQMGNRKIEFERAVVDAAFSSPAAKKAIGPYRG